MTVAVSPRRSVAPASTGRVAQHLLHCASAYAHVGGPVGQQAMRGHACHLDADRVVHLHGVEADTRIDVAVKDAKGMHGAQHVALLDDSDAVHGPCGILLDHLHGEAALAQRDGCCEAADAGADHKYG